MSGIIPIPPTSPGVVGREQPQVGMVPRATAAPSPAPKGGISSDTVKRIVTCTQAEYDAMASHPTTTVYFILPV